MRFPAVRLRVGLAVSLGVLLGSLLLGCARSGSAGPTPAGSTADPDVPVAAKMVWIGTYSRDIQPIFDQYCISCHGPKLSENGLRLDSYQGTMRGTQSGPVVISGSPATSTLMIVLTGSADPKIRMPHEQRRLTTNRLQNVSLWIEAGAPEK